MGEDAEWMIASEYAERIGIAGSSLKQAIDEGRIPQNAVKVVKAAGRGGKGRNVFINKTVADVAWVNGEDINHGNRTQKGKKAIDKIRNELQNNGINANQTEKSEKGYTSFAEAKRKKEIANAAKAQIELLKLQGSLVQKDLVYKQLFEAGKQLHDTIMGVPDRITAEIVAAGSNHTLIRKILTEALASSLEGLMDIYNKKLG